LQIGGTTVIDSSRNLVGINLVNQNLNMNNYDIYNAKNVNTTNLFASGNVGIGTTSPGSKLHVSQLIETGLRNTIQNLAIPNSCGGTWVSAQSGIWAPDYSGGCGDEWYIAAYNRTPGSESSTLEIAMKNDADDHIALMPSGNVGIGTINPGEKLEVAGNVKITGSRIKNSAGYGIVQTDATDWLRINPDSNYPAIALYNPVAIGTGGLAIGEWSQQSSGVLKVTQSAYLATAGGNVGIGTTNPDAKLDIYGASSTTTNLILSANYENAWRWRALTVDRGNGIDLDLTVSDSTDTQETLLQLSRSTSGRPELKFKDNWFVINDSNVGIGTASPTQKLEVAGNVNASVYYDRESSGVYLDLGGTSILNTLQITGNIVLGNGGPTVTNIIRGDRTLYAADETNVTTTNSAYELKKWLSIVFYGSRSIKPNYVNVIARLGGAAVPYLNVSVGTCNSTQLIGSAGTGSLVVGDIYVGGCSDNNVYTTNIYLRSGTSGSVVWNDIIEIWLVE
jgi:hypothetical protein